MVRHPKNCLAASEFGEAEETKSSVKVRNIDKFFVVSRWTTSRGCDSAISSKKYAPTMTRQVLGFLCVQKGMTALCAV
jgi:hypothetical protein